MNPAKAFFDTWGHVRVPGAFVPDRSQQMQDWIWQRLQTVHGIERGDPATWNVAYPGTKIAQVASGLSPKRMASRAFSDTADVVLGANTWELPGQWGGVLISFPLPGREPWTVAASGWHWDTNVMQHLDRPQNLFVFVIFSPIEAGGGGTLLLAGSHHLLNQFYRQLPPERQREGGGNMKRNRAAFHQTAPYLAALNGGADFDGVDRTDRFMQRTEAIDGTYVQVVEITGQPGDAFLCHPSLLHAVSQNRRSVPRFMRLTTTRQVCTTQMT